MLMFEKNLTLNKIYFFGYMFKWIRAKAIMLSLTKITTKADADKRQAFSKLKCKISDQYKNL